ncbi:MAG: CHASE3 domain-containing protein [Campylobacterales bacterium]|nr:CHASE3 domain-containing protein [Campylobacterales bacterium]
MINGFRLKHKIITGGLLPLIFLMLINVVGFMNFNGLIDGLKWVNHTHMVIQNAILIQKIAVDMETGERGFLLTGKEDFLEPYNKRKIEYDKIMEHTESLVSDNPKQMALLQQAHTTLNAWKTDIADKYIAKRKELDNVKSADVLSIVSEIVSKEEGKAQMDKFRELMRAIIDNERELLADRTKVADILTQDTNKIIIGGTIAAILFAIFIVIFLTKAIIQPIENLKECSIKISQGDLDADINVNSRDELGELANSFREMITYFKHISQIAHKIGEGNLSVVIAKRSENDMLSRALENMVTNLNTIMFELKHSVLSLNSATTEILATTTQVASSASQTSSAVAQTSASIEEIKQTAKASSAKAKQTTESTNKAMDIAKSGTDKLIENMQGLSQIKEKMDLIASNIVLLSQQSQQIGEITSTVEDIANQSNMLAVNASIEAVKAGEQGKGFSVVALELKNLSEQSKQGVKQVQKILTDIQKVTGTLVMVAEQGAKAVESGVKQALSAKTSMDKLNETVMNAANANKQISASYEQELAGMDQISGAMSSVKEATLQNLSSIKQVEESAHDLNGLSQKLRELMEHYIIADTK